jgi:hypothetical protein
MPPFDTSPSVFYLILKEVQRAGVHDEIAVHHLSKLGADAARSFFVQLYSYLFSSHTLRAFVKNLRLVNANSPTDLLFEHRVMCVKTDSPYQRYIGSVSRLFEDELGDYVLHSCPYVTVHLGIIMSPFDSMVEAVMCTALQVATWASDNPLARFIYGDTFDELRVLVAAIMAGLIGHNTDFIRTVHIYYSFANKEDIFAAVGLGLYLRGGVVSKVHHHAFPLSVKDRMPQICDLFRLMA